MPLFHLNRISRPQSFLDRVETHLPWLPIGKTVSSISTLFCGCSKVDAKQPSSEHNFALTILGLAAILGGEEAILAMATVHVYENRRWLGWYNSPGSYHIARRYARLAGSRLFDSHSLGVSINPAALFETGSWKAPRFRAAHSNTVIEETSPSATLIMKGCATLKGKVVEGRGTQDFGVTIANLDHVPPPQIYSKYINPYTPLLASIPISVSFVTCVACGVFDDWYSFASIFLGILANGISCYAIGSGRFVFTHPDPAEASPPGNGILISGNNEVVLLKGTEGAVNCITHGQFLLSFSSEFHFKRIRWCSVLLTIQSITQSFLASNGSLFGQIIFVVSLAISWIYNLWISSLDKEKIVRDILLKSVLDKPTMTKYTLGTRTAMAVFVLLVLRPEEPTRLLDELLPHDTNVWKQWKQAIVQRLYEEQKLEFIDEDWELFGFREEERESLQKLFGDAEDAYHGYVQYTTSQ